MLIYILYQYNWYTRNSGNSNPFISICNRNAEPSAQVSIKKLY
jgi:hypothetical protein